MKVNLTNKMYDVLKCIATYLLPALGTLYFALSKIWLFPYGEEVVGTITAIDAFLGAILGLSKAGFEGDGDIVVDTTNPDKDVYSLTLNDDPDKVVRNSKYVTLKVLLNPELNDEE